MTKDLSEIRVSERRMAVNHNETDYESFKEVKESIRRGVGKVNRDTEKQRRKESLVEWVRSVPQRWSKVTVNNLPEENAQRIKDLIDKKGGVSSVYICHGSATEMMDICYALGRRFVSGGRARFENFAFVNEESLSALSKSGFEGKKEVDKLFAKNKRVYVLTGVTRDLYDSRELSFMKRLIEHIYSNELFLIVSSSIDFHEFCENIQGTEDILQDIFKDSVIVLEDKKDSGLLDMFSKD